MFSGSGHADAMPATAATAAAHRHEVVARLSRMQGGAVARWQLLRLGVDDNATAAQLAARRWRRAHWGVFYTFSGKPDVAAQLWAALLFCGPGAVLSHESAAELYGMSDSAFRRRVPGLIHVTIAECRKERAPTGIRVHRSRLMPQKAGRHEGFPVTSAADTLLDLIGQARGAQPVVDWITRGCRSKATTTAEILSVMGRRKRQRHRSLIKSVCLDVEGGAHSPLEHSYLHRVERAHGLPPGRRQQKARSSTGVVIRDVDYEVYLLLVELDGRMGHEGVGQHRDASRDNDTTEDGKQSLRYGHAPVMGTPCEVARQVAVVLRRNGWTGVPTRCGPRCTVLRNF